MRLTWVISCNCSTYVFSVCKISFSIFLRRKRQLYKLHVTIYIRVKNTKLLAIQKIAFAIQKKLEMDIFTHRPLGKVLSLCSYRYPLSRGQLLIPSPSSVFWKSIPSAEKGKRRKLRRQLYNDIYHNSEKKAYWTFRENSRWNQLSQFKWTSFKAKVLHRVPYIVSLFKYRI